MSSRLANIFCAVLAFFVLTSATDDPRLAYIDKYSKIAISEMRRTGVPASITMAQGILESNSGRSRLASEGNNHFGIKCHKDWSGKKIYKDAEVANECFRAYANAEASFKDHSDFLRYQNRYKFLFDLEAGDYKGWAKGLKQAGYATDPAYPQKLIKLIEEYRLYELDDGVPVEAPAPLEVEKPKIIEKSIVFYKERISISLSRDISTQNGVPFVYAMEGETLEAVSRQFNLFRKELMKFNDIAVEEPLKAGEVIYLKSKRSQGARGLDKYVVDENETVTLRDISQRYAIKLSALEKLNPFAVGITLASGDTVRLR